MVTVEVLDKKFLKYKKSAVKTARWLTQRFKKGGFYLEIALVNSRTMPKNVLAFPARPGFPRPDIKQKSLGEIYLNPAIIKKQGWDFRYMLIHGFLHLLGYDHKKERDRINMERLEQKLFSELTD